MSSDLSTSFGEPAANYAVFRPQYPSEIFEFLNAHLKGRKELAIELGAGSGQATARIAEMFGRVIAVEPDRRLAEGGQFPENTRVEIRAAEDADFDRGVADAVLSATAFHWMDQQQICKRAAQWLRPGGVFFPFAFDLFRFDGAAQAFFRSEFEKWRPFRDRRLDENYDYAAVLARSQCFASVSPFKSSFARELSCQEAAGLICSTSFACAYARATTGPEAYFQFIKDGLTASGEPLRVTMPCIGALGRVD